MLAISFIDLQSFKWITKCMGVAITNINTQ
jgi:hypothetical protein